MLRAWAAISCNCALSDFETSALPFLKYTVIDLIGV